MTRQHALPDFGELRADRLARDNGADLLHLVGDKLVAFVEKQDAELLAIGESLRGAAIVEHRRPR